MADTLTIGPCRLGGGERPLLVAEMSGNHGGSLECALDLVRAAADAGVDAVKSQAYEPSSLTLRSNKPWFRIEGGPWAGRTLWDLYEEAQTPVDWQARLAEECKRLGLLFFVSVFDVETVDRLEGEVSPPAYKLSSFELNHPLLLRRLAKTGKPLVVSTGMATYLEIEYAVRTLREGGAGQLVLLKCVSAYPATQEGFHLNGMQVLRENFHVPIGVSDHTLGNEVAIAATALGASLIEKHFCLSREEGVVDACFSLEPSELKSLVDSVQRTHAALGRAEVMPAEQEAHEASFRRSILVRRAVAPGETLGVDNLAIVRPAAGLDPKRWDEVAGRRASKALEAGEPLREGDWE